MDILNLLLLILVSYLLGSVSGSMVLGKLRGVDIRTMGSGNAGGTNAFRTQGGTFALGVLVIDVGKGFIAAALVPQLGIAVLPTYNLLAYELLTVLCGAASVMGHVYPIYYGFKGGKGAGAAIGMILAISPLIILYAVIIWIVVLIITGYVGLATMLGAVSIPILSVPMEANNYFWGFSLILAVFILYAHRSNINRMIAGNENRFDNARIFHQKK